MFIVIGLVWFAVLLLLTLTFKKISSDVFVSHKYIIQQLDELIYIYYKFIVTHRAKISRFEENVSVFSHSVNDFLQSSHSSTADLWTFYNNLQDDIEYFSSLLGISMLQEFGGKEKIHKAFGLLASLSRIHSLLRFFLLIVSIGTFPIWKNWIIKQTVFRISTFQYS